VHSTFVYAQETTPLTKPGSQQFLALSISDRLMDRYYHSLSDAATIMATYSCPIIGKHVFQSRPVKMSLRAEQLL